MKGELSNKVIVHVWTSSHNRTHRGSGDSVGHVSIEIPHFQNPADPGSGYYSFWPDLNLHPKLGPLLAVPGVFMRGYRRPASVAAPVPEAPMELYDVEQEKRPAEVTVCFYRLDIYAMQRKFLEMKNPGPGQVTHWALMGKNILRITNNARSCASLARDLLVAGGISEFLPTASSSYWSSSPAPDSFLPLLKAAKKAEREFYPNTQGFPLHEGESDIVAAAVDYAAPAALVVGMAAGGVTAAAAQVVGGAAVAAQVAKGGATVAAQAAAGAAASAAQAAVDGAAAAARVAPPKPLGRGNCALL